QHGVKTTIIEMYENDEDLKLWIDSLPKVNFYFDDEDKVTISDEHIKFILDKLLLGDLCMGFGADIVIKCSYYYIKLLFITDITHFLQSNLQELLEIERNIIIDNIRNADTRVFGTTKHKVLN